MAVKLGNSWVSEAAYGFVNQKKGDNQSEVDMMQQLSEKFPDMNFSTNTEPFQAKGINNIAIAPNILNQMKNDPEKRMEYEALIYDCNSVQKTLVPQYSFNGKKMADHGFIMNGDGTLGSWSITKSDGAKKDNYSSCLLPKNDKNSWISRMMESSKDVKTSKINKTNNYEWEV